MSIITTFENQCRALTSAPSPDENASRFLVGTQSPNSENLIYLFEYKDDNNNLAKVSFKFPYGELWHLGTSSKFPQFVTGVTSKNKRSKVSLFRLPKELENLIEDDYGLSESPIENVFDLVTEDQNLTRQCHWHPDGGEQLLICNDNQLEFWDIEKQQKSHSFSLFKAMENQLGNNKSSSSSSCSHHVTDLRWSSLFNCSVVAVAIGSKICGIDTRIPDSSSSSICWLIDDVRCNRVRSIDFNPNSQYYLASGGDDCRANFWDLRRTSSPTLHLETHTHWIWSIRYNPFHDQLVLTAGGDARVSLMRVQSIASEPFGQMADDEEEEEDVVGDEGGEGEGDRVELQEVDKDELGDKMNDDCGHLEENANKSKVSSLVDNNNKKKFVGGDEVINVYEEHDDSVYAAEWATDPWIFASLGFESRLVINKVPKKEKFNILF